MLQCHHDKLQVSRFDDLAFISRSLQDLHCIHLTGLGGAASHPES